MGSDHLSHTILSVDLSHTMSRGMGGNKCEGNEGEQLEQRGGGGEHRGAGPRAGGPPGGGPGGDPNQQLLQA
jgi:hypothetical protein